MFVDESEGTFGVKTFVKVAKKCVLGLLILSIEVPCNACFFSTNTEYVASYGKENVPTGLYVMYEMLDASTSVMQELAEVDENLQLQNGDVDYNRKINGIAVKEMITARAKEKVMMHLAVSALFDELKLTLSAESRKQLEDYGKVYGLNKKDLAARGIGKESVVAYFENKMKYEQLYDHYYGEKGANKLSDKELRDVFDRSYVKLQSEKFPYSESSGENDKEAQVSANSFGGDVRSLGFAEALLKKEDEQAKKQKEEEEKRAKAREQERKKAKEEAEKKRQAAIEAKEKTAGKTAETADKAGARADDKTEDKTKDKSENQSENEPASTPERFNENMVGNGFRAPIESQKAEPREERLKRLDDVSISVMSEKQLRRAYKADERKLIETHPVGELAILKFPRLQAFVVVMSLQKSEEDFLAKKGEIARDVGTKKT
jgi:hypothetical protein